MTRSNEENMLIIVRGGGDIATGTIYKLWKSGYRVLVLESERPSAIRRQVAVCEAVYDGSCCVEDLEAVLITGTEQAGAVWSAGKVPVLVDPDADSIRCMKPEVVVDAILAKRNMGTSRDMAELVIGLGPGFCAGEDTDVVIETMRGHNLARVITSGPAQANTGIPGAICGITSQRVIHAQAAGVVKIVKSIGCVVKEGEIIAYIEGEQETVPVRASISGIIRGMIREGYRVPAGFKIADIDPRLAELDNCFTISDKARCIGGSVLEAVCGFEHNR